MKKSVKMFVGWGVGYLIAYVLIQCRWLDYRLEHPAGDLDSVGAVMAVLTSVITAIMMYFIQKAQRRSR